MHYGKCDMGIYNYVHALECALDWLGALKLDDINLLIPHITDCHKDRFTMLSTFSGDITLKELFAQVEKMTSKEDARDLMSSIIDSMNKPFSDAVVKLLGEYQENSDAFGPEDSYALWQLAKLTVDESVMCNLI